MDHLDAELPRPAGQPLPRAGQVNVTESLIARLRARQSVGIATYGTPLQTFNGRDMGQDADEELVDLWVYLQGLRLERASLHGEVQRLRGLLVGIATGELAVRDALARMVEYRLPEDEGRATP